MCRAKALGRGQQNWWNKACRILSAGARGLPEEPKAYLLVVYLTLGLKIAQKPCIRRPLGPKTLKLVALEP